MIPATAKRRAPSSTRERATSGVPPTLERGKSPTWFYNGMARHLCLLAALSFCQCTPTAPPQREFVFILTGSGSRIADSYDGSQQSAPLLHVEFGS